MVKGPILGVVDLLNVNPGMELELMLGRSDQGSKGWALLDIQRVLQIRGISARKPT
jgi:hypothetical protein